MTTDEQIECAKHTEGEVAKVEAWAHERISDLEDLLRNAPRWHDHPSAPGTWLRLPNQPNHEPLPLVAQIVYVADPSAVVDDLSGWFGPIPSPNNPRHFMDLMDALKASIEAAKSKKGGLRGTHGTKHSGQCPKCAEK